VLRVRNVGIPILRFTWYSITDQVDWSSALRDDKGVVDAVGLFDLDRNIRPVGQAYKQLIQDWSSVLPAQSYCLVLPPDMPDDNDPDPQSERLRHHAVRTAQRNAAPALPR
jgi:hypothetical protein